MNNTTNDSSNRGDHSNRNNIQNQNSQTTQNNNSGGRGFASMDQQRQREIASMGGKAAHESGNAHQFTSEEARAAGKKGGESRRENNSGE